MSASASERGFGIPHPEVDSQSQICASTRWTLVLKASGVLAQRSDSVSTFDGVATFMSAKVSVLDPLSPLLAWELEARVGIGQGLPIHCADNISFTQHVKRYWLQRESIFLNAEGRSLTV